MATPHNKDVQYLKKIRLGNNKNKNKKKGGNPQGSNVDPFPEGTSKALLTKPGLFMSGL